MYPFIRYASTIARAALKAKKGDTLTIKDISEHANGTLQLFLQSHI